MILFWMLLNKCKILNLMGSQYSAKQSPLNVRVVCPSFLLFLCCWLASFTLFVMKQCFVDTQCIQSSCEAALRSACLGFLFYAVQLVHNRDTCQCLVMSSWDGIAIISLCQLLCEEHWYSCYLVENLFMFLDTWVFCSFNV